MIAILFSLFALNAGKFHFLTTTPREKKRFGMIQMKLGLGLLLSRFRFNVCAKTDNPIKIDTVNLFHGPAGEVFLNIEAL
jgi:hypothetical protein